jgi:hypothetical protein
MSSARVKGSVLPSSSSLLATCDADDGFRQGRTHADQGLSLRKVRHRHRGAPVEMVSASVAVPSTVLGVRRKFKRSIHEVRPAHGTAWWRFVDPSLGELAL